MSDAQRILKEAMAMANAGKDEGATLLLRRLILSHPDSDLVDNAHYNLGILYKRQGRLAKAEAEFRTVIDLFPGSDAAGFAKDELDAVREANDPAADLFHHGQAAMRRKEYSVSRRSFESLIADHPESDLIDNAWLALAQIAKVEGNTATMIKILDRIERDYPGTDAAALVPEIRRQ